MRLIAGKYVFDSTSSSAARSRWTLIDERFPGSESFIRSSYGMNGSAQRIKVTSLDVTIGKRSPIAPRLSSCFV